MVTLDDDPERQVVIPLIRTNEGGASDSDYSGVPASLTFASGDTREDVHLHGHRRQRRRRRRERQVRLRHLAVGGERAGTTDVRPSSALPTTTRRAWWRASRRAYTVAEGSSVTVTVELDAAPERQVVIPLVSYQPGRRHLGGLRHPARRRHLRGHRHREDVHLHGHRRQCRRRRRERQVHLRHPAHRGQRRRSSNNEATVAITDDDAPASVTVDFAQDSYTVAEGSSVTVTVELDVAPERQVIIPLSATNQGGATSSDYGTLPASVTFAATDTEKTFTFTATDDSADDDGESVKFTFGTLPTGVSEGSTNEATVSITDDDAPTSVTVNFAQASYTVAEGSSVTVTVTLDDDPERQVVIPLTRTNEDGASDSDYSGVPANLTFASGDTAEDLYLHGHRRPHQRRRRARQAELRHLAAGGDCGFHQRGRHHHYQHGFGLHAGGRVVAIGEPRRLDLRR